MNFLGGSFRIGRLFGIDINVHFLYVLWAAFQLLDARGEWQWVALFLGMLFVIILLHELGHCFGARAVGGWANEILMWPLGGLAFAHAPMRPWEQFVTVAAGPAVNVAFCLISGLLMVAVTGHWNLFSFNPFGLTVSLPAGAPDWLVYVALFYHVNYWLLCFNLLPIYPMDGGQLFLTFIWPFVGLQRATILACQVGIAGAFFIGAWALMRMGQGDSGVILLLIAIMGATTCLRRLQYAQAGMLVDERIALVRPVLRSAPPRPSIWQRLFGRRDPRRRAPGEGVVSVNPNPGAWQQRADEERRLEEEVDRILQKVHEKGLASLSYVERQTLERASRMRQDRERELRRNLE